MIPQRNHQIVNLTSPNRTGKTTLLLSALRGYQHPERAVFVVSSNSLARLMRKIGGLPPEVRVLSATSKPVALAVRHADLVCIDDAMTIPNVQALIATFHCAEGTSPRTLIVSW